jgi:hypothetical protein
LRGCDKEIEARTPLEDGEIFGRRVCGYPQVFEH